MPRSSRYLGPGRGPAAPQRFRSPRATGIPSVVTPPPVPPSPYATALAAPEQTVVYSLLADWDRTGYSHPLANLTTAVSELTIDRSATGDLPIEAGLVEGYASAQLTAVLDGTFADGMTQAADALAPYRPDSALYQAAVLNAPMTCDIGLATDAGPETFTQFTGQVRSIRVDSAGRAVEIIASDPADQLREPITLPVHGIYETAIRPTTNQMAIRSQAIIDYVLRRNGIYASSPPHPQAQISCTGHGWLAAEAGVGGSNFGSVFTGYGDSWWVPGPAGMLAVRGAFGVAQFPQTFSAREQYSPTAGNGIGIAAWVRVGNDLGLPSTQTPLFTLHPCANSSYEIRMDFSGTGTLGGTVIGPLSNFSFGQPISTPAQWMYCGLHFQHLANGTTTITFLQNGFLSTGNSPTPAMNAAVAPFLIATASLGCLDWANFQVWYDPNPPVGLWPGQLLTLEADIDAGLNLMTILPDVVNDDSWTVIKDVAAAEYGLVGFDNFGRFSFKSRDHATNPQSIEKTVTADTSLLTVATTNSTDSVRNVITTETTAVYQNFRVIFQAADINEFDCQVGTTVFAVPLNYGETVYMPSGAAQSLGALPTSVWDSAIQQTSDRRLNGYVAVQAASPSTEVTSGITVLCLTASDRLAWVVVYNTSGFAIQFATTTGNPALGFLGYSPGQGIGDDLTKTVTQLISDAGSVSMYGSRALQIDASPYRQLQQQLETVAQTLLAELAVPIPVLDQLTINGDAELNLGDTVKIVDPQTNGTILASVVAITRRLSGGQLMDTLSVRPVSPP